MINGGLTVALSIRHNAHAAGTCSLLVVLLTDRPPNGNVSCSIPCNVPRHSWWEVGYNLNKQHADGKQRSEIARGRVLR